MGRIIGQERVSACRLNAKFAISAACQHTGIHQDSSRERERESQCPDTKMQRPCGDVSMHRFAAGRPWYPDSCQNNKDMSDLGILFLNIMGMSSKHEVRTDTVRTLCVTWCQ